MPTTAPYPLLSTILNYTRVRINDAIATLGGQTFVDTYDFTPVYVNLAWRMFQQYLLNLGYVRLSIPNFILPNVPPVANEDTSLMVTLSWSGYNDGVADHAALALPQDFIKPLAMAERPSDAAPNTNAFTDIDLRNVGRIPNIPKQPWNQIAVWNGDNIQMPGATVETDLRIDYAAYLPDFTGSGAQFPANQTADIMQCEDAFSGFIAYVFTLPRGDMDSGPFLANARDASAIVAGVRLPSEVAQTAGQ